MSEIVPAAKGISNATLRIMMPMWMDNLYSNLDRIRGGLDISDIPKKEKEPCIIVGAGPSLKHYHHISKIAKSWKHPVLCCDKVLRNCLRQGLVPYVSATVDSSVNVGSFYSSKYVRQNAKSIYGIFNSFTAPSVVNTWENYGGIPYWFIPELDLPVTADGKFNPGLSYLLACITKHSGVISGIGNVGAFLWNIAGTVLNCSPVILVGFDFSEQIRDRADGVFFNQFVAMYMRKYKDEKMAQDNAAVIHQIEVNPDVIAEETGSGWLSNYYVKGEPVRYLVNPVWKEYRNKFAASIAQSGVETINCTGNGCLHTKAVMKIGGKEHKILDLPNFKVEKLEMVLKEYA